MAARRRKLVFTLKEALTDAWSYVHLFGSFFLVYALYAFGVSFWNSVGTAIALGFLWEALDETLGKRLGMGFFDVRGFSLFDFLFDCVGVFVAILLMLEGKYA